MTYINFYPGSTREEAGISMTDDPAYAPMDIFDFVDGYLVGCTCSTVLDGAKDALEDGSMWVDLEEEWGEYAVQSALEEIRAEIGAQE